MVHEKGMLLYYRSLIIVSDMGGSKYNWLGHLRTRKNLVTPDVHISVPEFNKLHPIIDRVCTVAAERSRPQLNYGRISYILRRLILDRWGRSS
jgi:hypothetical protein